MHWSTTLFLSPCSKSGFRSYWRGVDGIKVINILPESVLLMLKLCLASLNSSLLKSIVDGFEPGFVALLTLGIECEGNLLLRLDGGWWDDFGIDLGVKELRSDDKEGYLAWLSWRWGSLIKRWKLDFKVVNTFNGFHTRVLPCLP